MNTQLSTIAHKSAASRLSFGIEIETPVRAKVTINNKPPMSADVSYNSFRELEIHPVPRPLTFELSSNPRKHRIAKKFDPTGKTGILTARDGSSIRIETDSPQETRGVVSQAKIIHY